MANPENGPSASEILDAYMRSSDDEPTAFSEFKRKLKSLSLDDLASFSTTLERNFDGTNSAFQLCFAVEQEISQRLRQGDLR
jgi:hypothetical protein